MGFLHLVANFTVCWPYVPVHPDVSLGKGMDVAWLRELLASSILGNV